MFNPATMEAFSTQGNGTMTIVKEKSATRFRGRAEPEDAGRERCAHHNVRQQDGPSVRDGSGRPPPLPPADRATGWRPRRCHDSGFLHDHHGRQQVGRPILKWRRWASSKTPAPSARPFGSTSQLFGDSSGPRVRSTIHRLYSLPALGVRSSRRSYEYAGDAVDSEAENDGVAHRWNGERRLQTEPGPPRDRRRAARSRRRQWRRR